MGSAEGPAYFAQRYVSTIVFLHHPVDRDVEVALAEVLDVHVGRGVGEVDRVRDAVTIANSTEFMS
jgi:hypothetical protein